MTMIDQSPIAARQTGLSAERRERLVLAAGTGVGGLILLALVHGAVTGRLVLPSQGGGWLVLHLMTVIPAIPLGAYVLLRPKGTGMHRMLGRLWCLVMSVAALSSFGLHSLRGGPSPIHLLAILVLVAIPRGIFQAMRHDFAAHRRTMALTYLGLAAAGLFAFMPGRLLSFWLPG